MRKTNSKPPGRGGGPNEPVVQRRGGSVDEDKVFQGLQKKQRCKLCEQEFLVDELPGAISYNSVLKLRQKWGKQVHIPSASLRYQRVKLCVFCSQFFDDAIDPNKQ